MASSLARFGRVFRASAWKVSLMGGSLIEEEEVGTHSDDTVGCLCTAA